MAPKLSIALFIPTYNVQGEIIPVLRAIPIEVLERLGKVYIIDNGSTDKTIDEIKVYLDSQNTSKFELYQNKVNEMLGGSTINAFNKSIHDDINFLICLHGDGQAKPKDLKQFIKKIDGGVEMEDIIDYKVPFGLLGQLVHPILVKPKLEEIFNYRKTKLEELFGVYK